MYPNSHDNLDPHSAHTNPRTGITQTLSRNIRQDSDIDRGRYLDMQSNQDSNHQDRNQQYPRKRRNNQDHCRRPPKTNTDIANNDNISTVSTYTPCHPHRRANFGRRSIDGSKDLDRGPYLHVRSNRDAYQDLNQMYPNLHDNLDPLSAHINPGTGFT